MKKLIVRLSACAAVMCGVFAGALTANAATVEELADVARKYGYPEEVIQDGINLYYTDPDEYPPEKLDAAIIKIEEGGETLLQEYFPGYTTPVSGTTAPPQTVTTTTAVTGGGTAPSTKPSSENPGGTSNPSDLISNEEFINMTYDEKRAYIAALTEDELTRFVAGLSPAAYKSMMSQLPTDKKLVIADNMAQFGTTMGMNLTIDELTNDKLSISIRDKSGNLVGVADAGITVEDTGYDYRKLFAVSGTLLAAAVCGLTFAVRKCFGKKKTGAENE